MTAEERVEKQLNLFIDAMDLKALAEVFIELQAQIVFLLDTYHLWGPDNTYTFPDGNMVERNLWEKANV